MRHRNLCTALLLLAAGLPVAWSQESGAADSIALIGECARVADDTSTGLAALESECPGIERALDESGYLVLIAPEQRDQLTAGQLAELEQIVARDRTTEAMRAPRADAVQPILKELRQQPTEKTPTLWERLERWLRSLTENQQNETTPWSRWLENFKLSEIAAQTLTYGAIALVIGLAIAILVNELRAAGVLRRRSARDNAGVPSSRVAVPANPLDTDLDALAPADRAPLLLNMLVATLIRTGRLQAERSLTHRELGLRASFDAPDERACFQRLTELAERRIYGGSIAPAADHDPVITAGRALNARLSGARQ